MDISFVKKALRIDHDDEDDLISSYIEAAEEYIRGACGEGVKLEKARAKQCIIMLVSDMYEQRTAYGGKADYSRSTATMLTQLRLETEMEAKNA